MRPDDIDRLFVPRWRSGVSYVPVAHEGVVYDEGTGHLHQLDMTAAAACAQFDGKSSLIMIIDELAGTFEGDRNTIERDVLELTKTLGRQAVLQGVEPGPGASQAEHDLS